MASLTGEQHGRVLSGARQKLMPVCIIAADGKPYATMVWQ